MLRSIASLLMLLLLAAGAPAQEAAPAAEAGESYEVQLHRPMSVGQRVRLEGQMNNSVAVAMGDQRMPAQKSNIDYDFQLTVDEVDARQLPTRLTIKVDKFAIQLPMQEPVALAEPGAIIRGSIVDGKPDFKAAEGRVEDMALQSIAQFVQLSTPGLPTDQDAFGASGPKRVGDTWPINSEATYQRLFENFNEFVNIKPENINGTMTLSQTGEFQGHEVVEYRINMNIQLPPTEVEGARIDLGTAALEGVMLYPKDMALQPLRVKVRMNMAMKTPAQQDTPAMDVQMVIEQTQNVTALE